MGNTQFCNCGDKKPIIQERPKEISHPKTPEKPNVQFFKFSMKQISIFVSSVEDSIHAQNVEINENLDWKVVSSLPRGTLIEGKRELEKKQKERKGSTTLFSIQQAHSLSSMGLNIGLMPKKFFRSIFLGERIEGSGLRNFFDFRPIMLTWVYK